MFIFPTKTEIDKELELDTIFKVANNGNSTNDIDLIEYVKLDNILDVETTGLPGSNEFKTIYVLGIYVNDCKIPYEFLEVLDKFIEVPVIYYIFDTNWGHRNFILPVKFKGSNGLKLKRIFASGWNIDFYAIDIVRYKESIMDIYKGFIEVLTFSNSLKDETVNEFVERLLSTKFSDNLIEYDELKKPVYSIDKGYKTYQEIPNSYILISDFEIKKFLIRSDAFEEQERVKFGKDVLHACIMDKDKGKILLNEKYSSVLKPDKNFQISFEDLSEKLNKIYSEIDNLIVKHLYGGYYEKKYNELIKLAKEYEISLAKRWCFFCFKVEFVGQFKSKQYQDVDLASFMFEGCSIKHFRIYDLEVYKFIR